MLEALVQSRWFPEASEIELLPGLPQQWTEGSVEGLSMRGGAAIDMRWKNGRVTSLELHATADGAMRLIPPACHAIGRVMTFAGRAVPVGADGVIHVSRGSVYDVVSR